MESEFRFSPFAQEQKMMMYRFLKSELRELDFLKIVTLEESSLSQTTIDDHHEPGLMMGSQRYDFEILSQFKLEKQRKLRCMEICR